MLRTTVRLLFSSYLNEVNEMRSLKILGLAAVAAGCMALSPSVTPEAHAQVSIGIGIGAEPMCPYGYYGYAPYRCAPYGYYGPEWFEGGRFVGAGRWYHGRPGFYGHVDRHYDPRYGYRGRFPGRDEHWHEYRAGEFRGGEMRGPRGEAFRGDHGHRR